MSKFLETSAKTGFNAQEMFIEAAKVLYIDYLKYNKTVFRVFNVCYISTNEYLCVYLSII